MFDETEFIARVAHEANRAYCEAIGDNSQVPWANAPEWQRNSAIAGVEFHRANRDATPRASHDSWLAQKQADGWAWAAIKNEADKVHPCMVPYEQLPLAQRAKDHIFGAICKAMLRAD